MPTLADGSFKRLLLNISRHPSKGNVVVDALSEKSICIMARVLTFEWHSYIGIFDRNSRFTSKFWISLQQALGTTLSFNITFHPQMMDNLKEPSRLWKICYGLMSWSCEEIGMNIYYW